MPPHPPQRAEKQPAGAEGAAKTKPVTPEEKRARQQARLLHIKAPARPAAKPGTSRPLPRWRSAVVRWMGLCLMVVIIGVSLLQVAGLHPAQQILLAIQTGPVGSFFLPPTPTPTPRPTPTPLPPPPGSEVVIGMIQSVFGSTYSTAALAVARCESGYNASAVNHTAVGNSHAEGVFQILYPSTWNTTSQKANSPFDANANILAAYEIFSRDGFSWREWQCKP